MIRKASSLISFVHAKPHLISPHKKQHEKPIEMEIETQLSAQYLHNN